MSATSTIPLWGRSWELTVTAQIGDGATQQYTLTQDKFDPEALRMTFDVLQSVISSPYWFADIAIYNLNDPTAQNLLLNAIWVTLKAGYQTGPSKASIIWDGPVMQTTFDKESVTDQIIRFNCIAIAGHTETGELLQESMVNKAYGITKSQQQVVSNMLAIANTGDTNAASLTPDQMNAQVGPLAQRKFAAVQYPRGKTVFGKVSKYIAQMSDSNFVNYWRGANGQHQISELFDPSQPRTPDITFGPPFPPGYTPANPDTGITRSIIGVPKQTLYGCIFTVLLDPRISVQVPPMLVALDQTLIQQLQLQVGQLPPVKSILSNSGIYIAGQVHHYGDTRGNPWYTEVSGYGIGWAQTFFNGGSLPQAAGAQ